MNRTNGEIAATLRHIAEWHQHDGGFDESVLLEAAARLEGLPKEPSIGLLMSMATRYDHGLGCPGYYDQPFLRRNGVSHARRLESTISTMRQLYEEASGNGFYSPELEEGYADMHKKVMEFEPPTPAAPCREDDEK